MARRKDVPYSRARYDLALERIDCGYWSVDPEAGDLIGPHGAPIGSKGSYGYLHTKCGGNAAVAVHRVIWEAVHGPITDPALEINHINGLKDDNRITNLELVDCRENTLHAYRLGLRIVRFNETSPAAKLTDAQVSEIRRRRAAGEDSTVLGHEFGCSASQVCRIAKGKTRPLVA